MLLPKIIELYSGGMPGSVIAAELRVSQRTIYRKLKIAGVRIKTKSETKMAESNPMWKGQDAQINKTSLHEWVKRRLPKPALCPRCKLRPALDLANISSKYSSETYNRDLENWRWLCRRCHMVEDGRIKNLRSYQSVTS